MRPVDDTLGKGQIRLVSILEADDAQDILLSRHHIHDLPSREARTLDLTLDEDLEKKLRLGRGGAADRGSDAQDAITNGVIPSGTEHVDGDRPSENEPQPLHRSYIALSYVWGSARSQICVLGGDTSPSVALDAAAAAAGSVDRNDEEATSTQMEVSSNLTAAIPHIKRQFPNHLLWTDNLSINQHDVSEKSYQVGLMGQIFASAETVVIWLGSEAGEGLMDLHSELLEHTTPTKVGEKERVGPEKGAKRRELIRRLSQIPWFYRAWTFQEIRLARRAVVLFGSDAHRLTSDGQAETTTKMMVWSEFIARIQILRKFEPRFSTATIYSEPEGYYKFTYTAQDRFFATLDELNARSKKQGKKSSSGDLAGLLFLTWYRDATEKRDKVYSLLSDEMLDVEKTLPTAAVVEDRTPVDDEDRAQLPISHGITIDYEVPWSDLCIKTARACMNTDQNLKILKIAGMKRRWRSNMTGKWEPQEFNHLLGHPSWAPDWWAPPQQTRSHPSLIFDERGCFEKLDFCCGPVPPIQDTDNADPFLTLKGVFLGVLNVDEQPTSPGGPPYVHTSPVCTGMGHRVLADTDQKGTYVPQISMPFFVKAMNEHLIGKCSCVPFHERQSLGQPPFGHTSGGPSIPSAAQRGFGSQRPRLHFSHEYFPLFHYARPQETIQRDFPAQVLPSSIESGDWLVLLEGGGLPFILRPVQDFMGHIRGVEGLHDSSSKHPLPYDAGLFALVGEASLCWDRLWPGRWEQYCRAGTFVIV